MTKSVCKEWEKIIIKIWHTGKLSCPVNFFPTISLASCPLLVYSKFRMQAFCCKPCVVAHTARVGQTLYTQAHLRGIFCSKTKPSNKSKALKGSLPSLALVGWFPDASQSAVLLRYVAKWCTASSLHRFLGINQGWLAAGSSTKPRKLSYCWCEINTDLPS